MTSRSQKRRSRRRQIETGHQRSWLTGRHAVTSMLASGIWPFTRLCATEQVRSNLFAAVSDAAVESEWLYQVECMTADRLTQLTGSRHHQGLAARMGLFPFRSLDALPRILEASAQQHSTLSPLVVICDRIQDEFNLGAILRCCDAMAVAAVVIGSREQSGISPQVARSSAGAVHHLPVIQVDRLMDAARCLADTGFRLLAASEKSTTPVNDAVSESPMALIVGSEAHGVSETLLEMCRYRVVIPMHGRVESLNVAVATGIVLYELRRGRERTLEGVMGKSAVIPRA